MGLLLLWDDIGGGGSRLDACRRTLFEDASSTSNQYRDDMRRTKTIMTVIRIMLFAYKKCHNNNVYDIGRNFPAGDCRSVITCYALACVNLSTYFKSKHQGSSCTEKCTELQSIAGYKSKRSLHTRLFCRSASKGYLIWTCRCIWRNSIGYWTECHI